MSSVRFLVVDDSEDNLMITSLYLEGAVAQADVQVEIVGVLDGETALRKLAEDGPFDLLITDANLPLVHGLDLLKRTRATGMTIPIIFMSADPSLEKECFQAGANAFLHKPFDNLKIVSLVRALLAH